MKTLRTIGLFTSLAIFALSVAGPPRAPHGPARWDRGGLPPLGGAGSS